LDNELNNSVISETGNGMLFIDILNPKARVLVSQLDVTTLVDNI